MSVLNDIFMREPVSLSDRHLNKKLLAKGFSERETIVSLYSFFQCWLWIFQSCSAVYLSNFFFYLDHFMVAFDCYQIEIEFKYFVRNTKNRKNLTVVVCLPSWKIQKILHNSMC